MNEIILSKEPMWFELNCEFTNLIVWKYTIDDPQIPVDYVGLYLKIIRGGQASLILSKENLPFIGKMNDCTSRVINSIVSLGDNPLPLNKELELIELLKKLPIVTM